MPISHQSSRPHPAPGARRLVLRRRGRRAARGFSLVEVTLALGIMGLAVISILGLIGPTLSNVKTAQEINVGTGCIEKMNTLIDAAPFWDNNAQLQYETVYEWVHVSDADSPTVFLFYDEIPLSTGSATQDMTPLQRVVRFNLNHTQLNTPLATLAVVANYQNDPNQPQLPQYRLMSDFVAAAAQNRVYGPVIAMTLSPSPLMKNFPNTNIAGDKENTWYKDPPNAGLFPTAQGMTADPSGFAAYHVYPEDYLPIYIQAFSVDTSVIQSSEDTSLFQQQLMASLTLSTRLFEYTTAKLR
jgi:type II secretory pathway pseudopilin PulG